MDRVFEYFPNFEFSTVLKIRKVKIMNGLIPSVFISNSNKFCMHTRDKNVKNSLMEN